MSDINEILADVKVEGDTDPFAHIEKETLTESLPVNEPEAVKPEEGVDTPKENPPFHLHPRWIERENELKALRERDEANAKQLAELNAFKEETSKRFTKSENSTAPEWFKELYGDNEVAWQKYSEREAQREIEITQKVIAQQEETRRVAEQQVTQANKWIETEMTRLQSEGKKFDKNELLQIMLETRPTTSDGQSFDFNAGYRTYELRHQNDVNPAKSQARKQLADTTTKSSLGEKKVPDYQTPASLRGKNWNNIGN